jgi:hypothetical protein
MLHCIIKGYRITGFIARRRPDRCRRDPLRLAARLEKDDLMALGSPREAIRRRPSAAAISAAMPAVGSAG